MTDGLKRGNAMKNNRAVRIKKKVERGAGEFFDLFDLILEIIGMFKNAK